MVWKEVKVRIADRLTGIGQTLYFWHSDAQQPKGAI